jgi:hypothetical protein
MAGKDQEKDVDRGSSPASRGGAGTYIEGELGAFYLLSMLADIPAHGLPGARIAKVRFQGGDLGYKLDDLIIHGVSPSGDALLEIQSKRDITFLPGDRVYRDVAAQIAKSERTDVAEDRHFLGIATQRTDRRISGAYQDVLRWAAAAENAAEFFNRLNSKGVGSDDMRKFVATSRTNLVATGVEDDDDAIWRILRRLLILEFDFESTAPLARTHGLLLAQQVLADEDAGRADGLWRVLVELSIAIGTTGGALNRDTLKRKVVEAGFTLAGDRRYAPARIKLADMARLTLETIGTKIAGVTLPRLNTVSALDQVFEASRYVEIRAAPGVGKSWVLRNVAERTSRQSPILVLDPVTTPSGGWVAFADLLGIPGTAAAFLTDLAASGGAVVFIDSLDMFEDPGRQRTVVDLLRTAAKVPGFRVIVTARAAIDSETLPWLDDDVVAAFGSRATVKVGALSDDEVETLVEQAPELKALLDPQHPAAALARNLYRLSRLLKVPSVTTIRTEAQLADRWWKSGDGAPTAEVRASQRILAELADHALGGEMTLTAQGDSPARSHLQESLTLKEVRRDQLDFYHDVLRDWAVGSYIAEDPARLAGYDLSKPVSARLARGIEFAGRLALEMGTDCGAWKVLLAQLSPANAHGSWRRQALLALTRSEARRETIEKRSAELLADGAALFNELCTAITAVETQAAVDVLKIADGAKSELSRSHRISTTGSAFFVLLWVEDHVAEIPMEAIESVAGLVEMQIPFLKGFPKLAKPVAEILFGWLRQLDVRSAAVTIPGGRANSRSSSDAHGRMVDKLRMMSLLLGEFAPDQLKTYLTEIAAERADHKVKDIRLFSQVVAPVAPAELADLILAGLVMRRDSSRRSQPSRDRALNHGDSDYLPPSPAQPPFLDLLESAPAEGLRLIRTLVAEAVDYYSSGKAPGENGFTLVLDTGPRFFPWTNSFFWSREQSNEYSTASGLKALEAWSHKRLDDGEPVADVLADILGPEGSCAAYLLVAIDVLLSHFAVSRDALAPFIASPEILAIDQSRRSHDTLGGRIERLSVGDEPKGKVRLADLAAKSSRGVALMDAVPAYLLDDPVANRLRQQLGDAVAKLEPFENHSTWIDERFVGRFVNEMLQRSKWVDRDDGNIEFHASPELTVHLEAMGRKHTETVGTIDTESRINLAIEGGEHATAETARRAVDYANGDLPDGKETDYLKSRSTRLIATALLVARDGDDTMLDAHEAWVRQVIAIGLAEQADCHGGGKLIQFNRPAMAALAFIHLWIRKRSTADRDALITLATRRDRAAVPAFAKAVTAILEVEPKLLKAAMRAAYSAVTWRWHEYDEDEGLQKAFEAQRDASAAAAVAAEVAWLDGAEEPKWPSWPEKPPVIRAPMRIRVPGPVTPDECNADADAEVEAASKASRSTIHVDSRAAAQWLKVMGSAPQGSVGWAQQIVEVYGDWSSRINGLSQPLDDVIGNEPSDWNGEFYVLVGTWLLDAPQAAFDDELKKVTDLPDNAFCDIAPIVLQAADAGYFNDPSRAVSRLVDLRAKLADRVQTLSRWQHSHDPGRSSIDLEISDVVAKTFFNVHNLFGRSHCYIPPLLIDRVDPLLAAVRPLLAGGPTAFVALCTMNLVLVAPRARHLNFLLDAVEAWFGRTDAASLWLTTGIGEQVMKWFEAAISEDPSLLAPTHTSRGRIDGVLGKLVSVGVAEAHEMELRVEAVAAMPQTVSAKLPR